MGVGDAVAGFPRRDGRESGGREQDAGEGVGQAALGDGPGRSVLRGPGQAYRRLHLHLLLAAALARLVPDALVRLAVRADLIDHD